MDEKHILVVDDTELMRTTIGFFLKKLAPDAKVHFAVDGKDALDKLTSADHKFDLVMTDIDMPIMTGPKLLEAIRAHEREDIRRVPVVGMSGDHDVFPGADAFLRKPFSVLAFKEALTHRR